MSLRFGEFVFDAAARRLSRAGKPVELSGKAFDLLGLLLAGRPAVKPRAEIQDHLWPQTHVGPTSLPRIVTELRQALVDSTAEPLFIRTVIGHGYAFCGEATEDGVSRVPSASGCALLWQGHEITLRPGENLIGRDDECVVRSRSPRVSRRHACIRVAKGRATIEDLDSRNGTFLDGRRLRQPAELADGGVIGVGPEVLVYLGPTGAGSTEADRSGARRG